MIMGADVSHAAPESKVIHMVLIVKGFKKGWGLLFNQTSVTKDKIPTAT